MKKWTTTSLFLTTLAAFLLPVQLASAAGPADGILPVEQYTSPKARTLATRYWDDLRVLSTNIYHCIPWVEVRKESIGFFKPRTFQTPDDRYLGVRIFVEQDPSKSFAALPIDGRASAMYSRYFTPLLRRMTRNPTILSDPSVDGFTILIEWLKQGPRSAGMRPVHELIATFVDRATATAYLSGQLSSDELTRQVKVFAWDGETPLGQVSVIGYDDDFVATYRNPNYKLEPGITCSS